MGKRKRSAFSCKSRSQRRPSPRSSASRGPPFTALSRQGGYAHILKGYFYTNLVGTQAVIEEVVGQFSDKTQATTSLKNVLYQSRSQSIVMLTSVRRAAQPLPCLLH